METIDNTQLRKFGFILSGGLIILFGLFFPLLKDNPLPMWPYILGLGVLVPAFIKPQWLNVIYKPWMKLGHVLGWINTRIILGIIFYLLITPMGLIMRLCRKDPMCRAYQLDATTYRTLSPPKTPHHMEKPF